ncbi:MAG: hypothetical protein HDS69_04260 [Bacteroidales bacterium]|nr:hypothetical protein [Bacteroidales bacterium]MBD5247143.1 hypothetical protein [Barnesiella sp.]
MNTKNFGKLGVIAAAAFMLAACGDKEATVDGHPESIARLVEDRDSLQQVVAYQDSLLSLINEIGDGMQQIKMMENILSSENIQSETPDRRDRIKNDMADIQRELNERAKRLSELEARLNKSNSNNAQLRQAISSLKEQIASQVTTIESLRKDLASANIYIDQLTQNVDSLNTEVANTIEQKEEVEQKNVELTNQLNECYYVIGSKSELKQHSIIETGFLKKTKIMPDDFQRSYFTAADQRTLTSIPLHSKKAKVLTNQPAGSYDIVTETDGMKVLKIKNPAEFWSTYKYLVIQID